MGLIVYESELKKIGGRFRWNSNGFVLIEFGTDYRNHFRLDLANQNGRGKRVYSGGDYSYELESIHLKRYLGTIAGDDEDETKTDWLYYYITYEGGGVWKWSRDYVKRESSPSGQFTRSKATDDEARNGHYELCDFLEDLGRVTNTSQTISSG